MMHAFAGAQKEPPRSINSATSVFRAVLPEYYCLQLFDDEYRGAMALGRLPTISGCFDDSGPCPDSTWYVRDAALPILPSSFFFSKVIFVSLVKLFHGDNVYFFGGFFFFFTERCYWVTDLSQKKNRS